MNTIDRNPKILPWLARKAGIGLHRAEVLWRAAQRHAAHSTGATGTSPYWAAAMDRLLELVINESVREDAASFGWRRWARLHSLAWRAPLAFLDEWSLNLSRNFNRWQPARFG